MDVEESSKYSIPVPAWFRCEPLNKLPWGALSIPSYIRKIKEAELSLSEKIKKGYGVKHCILTDSARSAYAIYIRATKLDGEIIVPSMMHTPTAVLLSNFGLKLALCDVNHDFCTSVEHLEKVVSPETRAVMITHMFGRIAPIDVIEKWAAQKSIAVLSNMVHIPPNVYINNNPIGAYGDVGFLSFNMDKPLQGIYGGAMLTNSDDVYSSARKIQLQSDPISKILSILLRYLLLYRYKPMIAPLQYLYLSMRGKYYKNDDVQRNFESFRSDAYVNFIIKNIHPLQAAFACNLIDNSDQMVATRRRRANQAISALSDIEGLILPKEDYYSNTFQYFPLLLDKTISRYKLGVKLSHHGIETKWRYYPLHMQNKFNSCRKGDLSNTEYMWAHYLLLPVLYGDSKDIDEVVNAIRMFIHSATKKI